MTRRFALPDIGSGLQEAEIIEWHVQVGDAVTTDQTLCEIETEKSVVEIPVPYSGVVLELAGPVGTAVMVGEMLVVIGETDELGVSEPGENTPGGLIPEFGAKVVDIGAPGSSVPPGRPQAMPLVRQVARDLGVDLAAVEGTGVEGRVTRADVEQVVAARPATAERLDESSHRTQQRTRLSLLRRTIATHMTAQWQAVPHITAHVDAVADQLMSARARLSDRLARKIPMDALLVAAVIPALRRFPAANALVEGDDLVVRDYYDIGVAVGSVGGVVVPMVRDADRLTLSELVEVVSDVQARAKDRRLRAGETGHQTFTISNLGGLRGRYATQVIPVGTTGIVSFGRATDRAVVRDGGVVAMPVMAISGTFDHRAMDGVEAMGVLNEIVDAIEDPKFLGV